MVAGLPSNGSVSTLQLSPLISRLYRFYAKVPPPVADIGVGY
jgi:hypothetical protein